MNMGIPVSLAWVLIVLIVAIVIAVLIYKLVPIFLN